MDSQQQSQQQQSAAQWHSAMASQQQAPASKYEAYTSLPRQARPSSQSNNGDTDGDRIMEDADPYNRNKYSSARTPTQKLDSNAARRYSPMNTSPYLTSSPTRQMYSSPTQPRPNQLPPIQSNADFYPSPFNQSGPQSPRLPPPSQSEPPTRGPVPVFTKCDNVADLQPRVNGQPPFRRANPEGGFISPLHALTTQLPATYRICNPNFQYESSRNPRRVLTKPSKGSKNDGYDNEDSDYILYVNDILGSDDTNNKNRYLILDVLGQGTFGQVVKCQNLKTQEVVAVKVVKNRTAYFNQSMMEVSVLDLLNGRMDKNDDHHILRLKDTFIHRQHLCLVFELLSVNLYELIKQNQFRGLSTTLVRVFAQQLLAGLCLLSKARLIHCDLKPENILLKNLESPIIKIIDFGSACDERQTVYTYIQSRFYRSPEVLLGLPYSAAIDMWSLGCIVVELFLGLPLFPGSSEYNQVSRITEMLGLPPTWMLEVGKQSGEFFEKAHDEFGRKTYRLKPMDQYSREHGTKEQPSKKYFSATTLPEIIRNYPMPRKGMKQAEIDREMNNRVAFIDFVHGLLNINPLERWTPQQARTHPFITQSKFTGPFQPGMHLKSTTSRSPAPGVQQQQQAEALSKQRAQAAQQQQHQQQQAQSAANAAYAGMHMQQGPPGYPTSPHAQQSPMYSNMYTPTQQQAPPPYPSAAVPNVYNQAPMLQQPPPTATMHGQQAQPHGYQHNQPQSSLYAQATTRAGRQRASTMDLANGIPSTLQRVATHLDPNAPIRLQPSPAYYPPPNEQTGDVGNVGGRRRMSRGPRDARSQTNFVRQLEDRTLEEGWTGGNNGGSGGGSWA
ncbi:kinase-like protein [Aureobasidium pullulans]|nr:kinase-like protein [Aureobasidium pullulans]